MITRHRSAVETGAAVIVVPGRIRCCYWLLVAAVCVCGGWLWLGNSGAGLLLLWCCALRPWRRETIVVQPAAIEQDGVVMEPWRLSMQIEGEPIEVFRDELSARDWAMLRAQLRLNVR